MFRIGALLTVLIIVAAGTWLTERRLASWERPVWVTFYPLAGDNGEDTRRFLRNIDEDSYRDINRFFETQARRFGIELTPVINIQVAPPGIDLPPEIPDRHSPHLVAWWSLKMRFYAWNMDRKDGLVEPDIQVFAIYHGRDGRSEKHLSVGMRKGMYGVVNLFAADAMNTRNQMVIAHELMHVFGASDKYSMGSNEPLYPDGYAEPNKAPLFPQDRCEIMGGRIPLSAFESIMPNALSQCTIGIESAREIGFYDKLTD